MEESQIQDKHKNIFPFFNHYVRSVALAACNNAATDKGLLEDNVSVTIGYHSEDNFRERYGDLLSLETRSLITASYL
ncbi:hypothetical protein DUZ99_12000 [Xylanibacillus composti]|uniref:Uncharacterized protein n=1 Tax=Xylanibacillus composti TaxID=1572762 RepID=A0A8J4M3T3_9BACL|nr:hypothetical protein [Xylanibacillus composti]GIQ71164.1 hypothetical protein XYCOK13_39880 [Xylanibacillus composti]